MKKYTKEYSLAVLAVSLLVAGTGQATVENPLKLSKVEKAALNGLEYQAVQSHPQGGSPSDDTPMNL